MTWGRVHTIGRPRAIASILVTSVTALVGVLAVPSAAQADIGRVRGAIMAPRGDESPTVKVSWFTADWVFVGSRRVSGGAYSLALDPGTYHLQFTDKRPAYDIDRYAPADVEVTVNADATQVANVHLRVGASIGGTVIAGGKAAANARVVAVNAASNSFETIANKVGEFALGGLPPGSYSVFTYDSSRAWTAKSVYLASLKSGVFRGVNPNLSTPAGRLVLDLYAGDQPYPGVATLTAVNTRTGQFWTQKASHGTTTFQGLYPGKYRVVVPGAAGYLGGTFRASATVKPGRVAFGSVRLTQRGASVAGTVVDANHPAVPLGGAAVVLYDGTGQQLGHTTSAADGSFTLGGQLSTRTDLSVVVGPGPDSPYLGTGVDYCKYGSITLPSIAVRTGLVTDLGAISLPHLPDADQDGAQCRSALGPGIPAQIGLDQ